MNNESPNPAQLPSSVQAKLGQVRRREFSIRLQTGLLRAAAFLLVIVLTAMTVDRVATLFDPSARWLLTVVGLGASAALFLAWCLAPLLARRSPAELARKVDGAFPALEERWSTVAELAANRDAPELRGSDQMIEKVTNEAESMSQTVRTKEVISTLIRKRMLQFFAGALAVFLLQFALDPAHSKTLLLRFLMPGKEISLTQVTAEPGDTAIGRDESLVLKASTANNDPSKAALTIREADGEETTIGLSRGEDTAEYFAHQLKKVAGPFQYRFRSGDGQTPWHRVTVVDRPRISAIHLRVDPPAYTGNQPTDKKELPAKLRILEGSQLEVAFQADQPLSEMNLLFSKDEQLSLTQGADGWYRFQTTVSTNLKFSVAMLNEHKLDSKTQLSSRIIAFKDRAPTVDIVAPNEETAARPDDKLKIDFEAKDDFGIEKAELLVTTRKADGKEETKTLPIDLKESKGAKSLRKQVELDLASLDLKTGDEVTYAVQVTDNRQLSDTSKSQGSENSEQQDGKPQLAQSDKQSPNSGGKSSPSDSEKKDSKNSDRKPSDQEPSDTTHLANNAKAPDANQPFGKPSDPKKDNDPTNPSNKPPNDMARRMLPGQCSACKPMNVQIDEWAGQYDGKIREKQQLAIESILKELDTLLANAEGMNTALAAIAKTAASLPKTEAAKADEERGYLRRTEEQVAELKKKTAGTPYMLIGLQIHDIGEADVTPARKSAEKIEAGDAARAKETAEALEQTGFHIANARRKLADLTRTYEAAKRDQKIADAMQKLEKMHQIFLENSMAMLGGGNPGLNSFDRKMAEVDDEFAAKMKELLEEKKKIMAELAELLGEDPRLLRRFMAMQQLQADTLRDQMTLLAQRQQSQKAATQKWLTVTHENREATLKDLRSLHARSQFAVSKEAMALFENLTTWLPLDLDPKHASVQSCRDMTTEIIRLSDGAIAKMAQGDTANGKQAAEQSLAAIRRLREELPKLNDMAANHARLPRFTQNRADEASALITLQSGWIRKLETLQKGDFHEAAQIDQRQLAVDTKTLHEKLDSMAASLRGVSWETPVLTGLFLATITDDILAPQTEAVDAFADKDVKTGAARQSLAAAGFAAAEEQFDNLLKAIIAEMDAAPPPAEPGQNKTLDQLMAMLEEEMKAAEKLGIPCRPLNISIEKDWMKQGSQPSPSTAAAQQMKAAISDAKESKRRVDEVMENMREDEKEYQFPSAPAQSWNVLASKLGEDLQQGRGNVPPERYRKAIEQYFRQISQDLPAGHTGK